MLGRGKNRSICGAIFFLALFCFAGCDNYNQSIEDFIYYQTGKVLPRDQAPVISPPAEQYPDGSFHIRAAAADIVVELDLENDRGYDLRLGVLNNGTASEAVRAEQTAPDRVLVRIAGAKPEDVFRIVLQVGSANGYRSFGEIPLPAIYCDAPPSSARELLSFAFGSWTGTIDESAKTVAVTVSPGTAISDIIPTATVSAGADYSPKEAWGSGDSDSTKTYTVTAEDGASADYAVTVTIASAPVYHIVVVPSANGTVTASVAAAMEGATVTLTVNPAPGYSLKPGTLLVNGGAAGMSGSGGSYSFVMPGMDAQITAEFASSAKELLSFNFGSWAGTVNESAKTVAVTVPYGTAISGITPTATVSTGADYSPKNAWGSSVSGSAKTYTVTAEDGTSADYVVAVTIAAAPVYSIVVSPSSNGTVTASVATAMAGETVTLTVNPASGYSLKPGSLQVNGGAAGMSGSGGSYSFVMPGMDAQITAEFVSSAKELLSFAFGSWAGTVNESAKTVTVTVPYGTAISGIIPTATVSTGADYSPKETWGSSASGSTKTYTVTAGDGTSANYVATVTIAAVPVYNIVVSPSANGTVTVSATTAMAGETVTLTVNPASGYGLKPGTLQVNGGAIGMSGSGGSYSFVMPGMDVQITAEFASSAKELLSFAFGSWAGTVNESAKTVAVTVPYGTLISAITPTATVSAGADYNPKEAWGSGVSGSTKTYTVTAADGTSADYVATVTIAAPPVYNIVATPSLNGAVTASPTSAPMGETVALTVSPDSGSYGLKAGTLLVKETSSGAPVALSESGGSYSFVMPPANVTVTAEFVAVGSSFSVAQRGVTLYESLKDAIAAAPSGSASSPDEIILLKTIELPESGTTGYVIDKHIKLVSSSGTNAIERKNTFTNDSLFTVSSGASLTLDGSPNALVIDGDNVSANAALITVDGGTLNMYDGVTLKNNKNTSAYYGGGVRITSGGSFIMNGGTISGNTANSNGGGVYVSGSGSRFEMQGGTIGGSGTGEKNTAVNGGGVMVSGGASFEMTAGFITGNTASSSGGGVDISGSNSRFEMQGGSITGNTAVNGGGVGIIGINNPSARFEMQGGSITGNIASGNGGGVHISEGAALFEMKGGTIGGSGLEKNTAANGGGVVINNGASFEMTAGSITGNNVGNNRNGGGVYISGSNSRFEMKGGSITGNNAGNNSNGGGVYISGSGSRFEMKGGALGGIGEENTVGSSGSGGGVYVANPGEFAMSGAAYLIGNGVHVFGTITMEGGARVADEWVYLTSGTVITLKGDMTGTVPVAVIYPADTTTGTKVLDGTSPLIPNNKAKFNVDIAGPNPPPPYSGSNITIDGRLP